MKHNTSRTDALKMPNPHPLYPPRAGCSSREHPSKIVFLTCLLFGISSPGANPQLPSGANEEMNVFGMSKEFSSRLPYLLRRSKKKLLRNCLTKLSRFSFLTSLKTKKTAMNLSANRPKSNSIDWRILVEVKVQ